MQVVPTKVPTVAQWASDEFACKLLKGLEARAGIEPAHKGFADLSLTTWVPRLWQGRLGYLILILFAPFHRSQSGWRRRAEWSGRRDLNSRPSPWQGDALPLSYSRVTVLSIPGHLNEVKRRPETKVWKAALRPLPARANRSANPVLPAQSRRRACTECGWQSKPPPGCG
jgi:hypothetical protein